MEDFNLFNEKDVIAKWIADIYDQNETQTYDIDFMLPLFGQKPKRILEVACGSGRILVPLAKAGHTVYGIDADGFMLEKISAKAEGLSNIQWHKADAVNEDWGTGYDLVVLAGNILYNIVSDGDYAKAQEALIKKAASSLVKNGYVYIDYKPQHSLTKFTPSSKSDKMNIVWEGYDTDGNFGKMMSYGSTYDAETQINSFIRRFELTLKSGETITQDIPSQKHFATLKQLHEWLHDAGFIIEHEYGNYNKDPISDKTHGAIIYAQKI